MKTAKTEFGANLTFKMRPHKDKSKLGAIPRIMALPLAQTSEVMWPGTSKITNRLARKASAKRGKSSRVVKKM